MSKKTLTRKLDKIVSLIVRKRGKCEKCGKTTTLQCCHIFSRTYRNTRWSLDNVLCLCAGCHFWGHKNPILFTEFIKTYYGNYKYELLKEAHHQIAKFTAEDLDIKLKVLEDMR